MLTLLLSIGLADAAPCNPALEPWPYERARRVRGGGWDLRNDLSGAVWHDGDLWLVRNSPGRKGELWRLDEEGWTRWEVEKADRPLDLEAVTVDAKGRLLVLSERNGVVWRLDVSQPGLARIEAEWGMADLPGRNEAGQGPEGLTALPNNRLLIGHQDGGNLYTYILADAAPMAPLLSISATGGPDTSGLELVADTGELWVWHNGFKDDPRSNRLEIGRLVQQGRWLAFCPQHRYDWGDSRPNIEGIAVSACVDGERSLWLATDGGRRKALREYKVRCGD